MKFTNRFLAFLTILIIVTTFAETALVCQDYKIGRFENSYNLTDQPKAKVKVRPASQIKVEKHIKRTDLLKQDLPVNTSGKQGLNKTFKQNNIIFDVGGVLLEVSKFRAFTKLGIGCIFHTDIGDRLMEFMSFIEPETEAFSIENQPKYLDRDLPPLMCRWQKGEFTCQELVDKIKDAADKNPKFFKNKSEHALIKKSADLLLPAHHVDIEKIKPSGLRLIKQLKNKKDKNGNFVNNLFIISNFDYETFGMLEKKFPEVFGHFNPEQIIVSGRVKMIKPHKNIFEHTLNKFQLNPKSCIFIDDQLENVKGAKSCGMSAIHHTSSKNTNNRLKALGIL